MFVNPQDKVYGGMLVGEHNRDNDLGVNVLKGKSLQMCVRQVLMMPLFLFPHGA